MPCEGRCDGCVWKLTLQDVGRTHVDLGDHHKHGHVQGQGQPQVLLGHAHDARVTAHLERDKERERVREMWRNLPEES